MNKRIGELRKYLPILLFLLLFIELPSVGITPPKEEQAPFPYLQSRSVFANHDLSGRVDLLWSAFNTSSDLHEIVYVKVQDSEYLVDPVILYRGALQPKCMPINDTDTFVVFWHNTTGGFLPLSLSIRYTKIKIIISQEPQPLTDVETVEMGDLKLRRINGSFVTLWSWGNETAGGISCSVGKGGVRLLVKTKSAAVPFDAVFDDDGNLYLAWWDTSEEGVGGIYFQKFNSSFVPMATPLRKSLLNVRGEVGLRLLDGRLHLFFTAQRSGEEDVVYTCLDTNGTDIIDDVVLLSVPERPHISLPPPDNVVGGLPLSVFYSDSGSTDVRVMLVPTRFPAGRRPVELRENLTEMEEFTAGSDIKSGGVAVLWNGEGGVLYYPRSHPETLPEMVCTSTYRPGEVRLIAASPGDGERIDVGGTLEISTRMEFQDPLPEKIGILVTVESDGVLEKRVWWVPTSEKYAMISWHLTMMSPGRTWVNQTVDPGGFLPPSAIHPRYHLSYVDVVLERLEINTPGLISISSPEPQNLSLAVRNVGYGTVSARFSAFVNGLEASWVSLCPSEVENLSEGASTGIWLNITPTINLPPGEYNLTVQATSIFTGEVIGRGHTKVVVDLHLEISISGPEWISLKPSSVNTFTIYLTNRGNVVEKFWISGRLSGLSGYVLVGGREQFTTKPLMPGQGTNIGVSVQLTGSPPPDTSGEVLFTVIALSEERVFNVSYPATVVKEVCGELHIPWETYIYNPGSSTNITGEVSIKNTGNVGFLPRFYFVYLPVGWRATYSYPNSTLSPGNSTKGAFIIEFTKMPEVGEYSLTLILDLAEEGGISRQYHINIVVESFLNISCHLIVGDENVTVDMLPFSYRWVISIKNCGNVPVSVQLFTLGKLYRQVSILLPGGEIYNWTEIPEVQINPGESVEISVELNIESKPEWRENSVVLKVFVKDEERISSEVMLNLSAPGDEGGISPVLISVIVGGMIAAGLGGFWYYRKRRYPKGGEEEGEEEV